jgi:hypothetical protein
MPRVSSVATLVALAASAVLWAAPAHAQVGQGSLETDRRPGVLGAQLVVRSADTSAVVFRLWTPPGNDGSRRLWSRCPLSYIGTAEYRCEFDVGGISPKLRAGTWLVRVRAGSRLLAEQLEMVR